MKLKFGALAVLAGLIVSVAAFMPGRSADAAVSELPLRLEHRRRPGPAADRGHRKQRQPAHAFGPAFSKNRSAATAALSGPNPLVRPGSHCFSPSRSIISRCFGSS